MFDMKGKYESNSDLLTCPKCGQKTMSRTEIKDKESGKVIMRMYFCERPFYMCGCSDEVWVHHY